MKEYPTPVERLSKRESERFHARLKRNDLMRAGEQFWDDVMGRTYVPLKALGRKVRVSPPLEGA